MTIEFDGQNNKLGTTTADSVTIKTNDTDAITVDTSQNVGVGTTSPSNFAGYTTLGINNTTNGGLLELQNSGTTYGQIFTDGTNFHIRSSASATALIFDTNGANERMRITSAGLHLGGTGSANALDDYEEGTWTPTFTYTSTTPSFSYVTRSGRYTKIGRMVQIGFQLNVTSIDTGSAGGEIEITGLPFPCKSQSLATGVVMVYGADVYANAYDVTINVQDNSSNFRFMQSRDNEGWINMSTANDAGQLVFQSSFVYDTDS